MKNFLKKAYPHLIAIVSFLILSSVYFSPTFNDYKLNQSDINQFRGMEKEIVDYRLTNEGEEPLWTNAMFGGMPAYQISVKYGSNLMKYVGKVIKLGQSGPVGTLFMAMLGFYILSLCMGVKPWVGIIGGIAFGFSTINILYLGAGHVTKVNAISYMAPTLGGLILAFRGKLLLGGTVFALFFSLHLTSNHFQMTYYLTLLMGAVSLAEVIRLIIAKEYSRLGKTIGVLLIASILAPLPSIGNFMTTLEYSDYTTRGTTELTIKPEGAEKAKAQKGLEKDYILEYNYGKMELLSIIAPGAQGEKGEYIGSDEEIMDEVDPTYAKQISQMNRYWGGQRMSGGAFYFGVIMLVLAIFGIIFIKDTIKWPLVVIAILCLFLASNNHGGVNAFFIDHFPLYNKFRDSKMILVLMQLIIPILAVLFFDKLLKQKGIWGNKKTWLIASGAIVLVGIILYASPSISGTFITKAEVKQFSEAMDNAKEAGQSDYISGLQNELKAVRKNIYKSDMGRALFLMILACGLVLATLYIKMKQLVWIGIGAIMVTADNMSISKRYLNNEGLDETNRSWVDVTKGSVPYIPTTADIEILDSEKGNVKSFDSKVSALNSKMEEANNYKYMSSSMRNTMAEFGVLNLNTDYRVLNFQNPWAESATSYFHKSLGGYHGAKLKRIQEMIDFHIGQEMQEVNKEISALKNQKLQMYASQMAIPQDQAQKVFDTIVISDLAISEKNPVLNMLNTNYIITNPNSKPVKNTNANGNAWFVNEVIKVKTADDEITKVKGLNSKQKVIANEADLTKNNISLSTNYNGDSTDYISLKAYRTKEIEYISNAKSKRVAVFSEIHYPEGWNLYVDNKQQPYFRANYLIRGAEIPAGKHTIVWKFEPSSFTSGNTIGLIGSLLLLSLILIVFGKNLIKTYKDEENSELEEA